MSGRRGVWLTVVLLAAAVASTTWLQQRRDPAADEGVRIATVLQLQADAALAATESDPGVELPDAGGRAARAAAVRRIWDDSAQRVRLAAVQNRAPGKGEVRFVVARWQEVVAHPRRARVVVVGHYERRGPGEAWTGQKDRTWRVQLRRMDPVGATRGWRLVSVESSA